MFEVTQFSERNRQIHHHASHGLADFCGHLIGLLATFLTLAPNRRVVVEIRVKDAVEQS